jgi:4-diphosphocytidyl-2-C-methyl-D-erythritol kinase
VLQRLDFADRVSIEHAPRLEVSGFARDTLVQRALETLAETAGVSPRWRIRLTKRIPVAAGLGGGSSDAATALRLANDLLAEPVPANELRRLAGALGADVPFFLEAGPQLGRGDGSVLEPLALPQDYWVLLVLPHGTEKGSTAAVYEAFDARHGEVGFTDRARALERALEHVDRPRDLAALPPNDLASSSHAARLCELGAFRADVSGAGPVVYGLFHHRRDADAAAAAVADLGQTWISIPVWYG